MELSTGISKNLWKVYISWSRSCCNKRKVEVITLFPLILQYFLDSKYELTSPRATHLAPDDEGGGGWHWHEYWQNVS